MLIELFPWLIVFFPLLVFKHSILAKASFVKRADEIIAYSYIRLKDSSMFRMERNKPWLSLASMFG